MYEPFEALLEQGSGTRKTAKVVLVSVPDKAMCVLTSTGAIVITKEQAMKFFGLVDPNTGDDPRLASLTK